MVTRPERGLDMSRNTSSITGVSGYPDEVVSQEFTGNESHGFDFRLLDVSLV